MLDPNSSGSSSSDSFVVLSLPDKDKTITSDPTNQQSIGSRVGLDNDNLDTDNIVPGQSRPNSPTPAPP